MIMNTETKRATIYLEQALHKALRIKAAETSRSMSDIINNAVKQALKEDAEDLAIFEERTSEPLVSYENMLKELKKDGRI